MTGAEFGRILTLLRKEKGMSQKIAAEKLGVSQALLSHYERGIRECGLDFVIRVAELYNVSCDYLLGRSPERTGSVLNEKDIPEPESAGKENRGSLLPTLNKKIIANSLNVLYGLLSRAGNSDLTNDVSAYLNLAVYNAYRHVYSLNAANQQNAFSIGKSEYEARTQATMALADMRMRLDSLSEEDTNRIFVSSEQLYRDYPLFAGSLLNLVRNAEENIKDTVKDKD